MVPDLLVVSGAAAVAVAALMAGTAWVAWRSGRVAVVDTAWGLAFLTVALTSAVTSWWLGAGDSWLRWLLVALVGIWGIRLSWHLHRRNHGAGEDPRYAQLLGDAPFRVAVAKVFVVQGVAVWFVSLPIQTAAVVSGPPAWWLAVLGGVLWAIGITFESVADAQLAAYKQRLDRPPVMDTGLWRYTRHPNYFGDACAWWGVWLIGASTAWWVGPATLAAPLAMTYLLVHATGARLLEQTMMRRPGYPKYAARTSMFLPLLPRTDADTGDPIRGPFG